MTFYGSADGVETPIASQQEDWKAGSVLCVHGDGSFLGGRGVGREIRPIQRFGVTLRVQASGLAALGRAALDPRNLPVFQSSCSRNLTG
jgi:hypothetical protein